jgi:hypothetical protein
MCVAWACYCIIEFCKKAHGRQLMPNTTDLLTHTTVKLLTLLGIKEVSIVTPQTDTEMIEELHRMMEDGSPLHTNN